MKFQRRKDTCRRILGSRRKFSQKGEILVCDAIVRYGSTRRYFQRARRDTRAIIGVMKASKSVDPE